MANYMARVSRGRTYFLLVLLGSAVTGLSLILDNVTTVVIFGPLIIIARSMKISPIPFLLAAALLSDTGGVATLVGDPSNLMIGSAKNIGFNTFFYHMAGIVIAAWIGILLSLKLLFRKELTVKPVLTALPQDEFLGKAKFVDRKLWNQSLFH